MYFPLGLHPKATCLVICAGKARQAVILSYRFIAQRLKHIFYFLQPYNENHLDAENYIAHQLL